MVTAIAIAKSNILKINLVTIKKTDPSIAIHNKLRDDIFVLGVIVL